MGADRWHRAKAFRPRLVRPDGMCTDVACDMAWERGYFDDAPVPAWDGPDNMHPVTPAMLLEAIERELAGRPRYPNGNDAPYLVPEWDDAEWEAAFPEDAPAWREAA